MQLKIGSSGEEVKKLQRVLGLNADGVFSASTETALKAWQTLNGFVADGVISDSIWSKLFGVIPARDRDGNLIDENGDVVEIHSAEDVVVTPNIIETTTVSEENNEVVTPAADVKSEIKSVSGLNLQKLKGIIPDAVIAQIPLCAEKFAINTPLRLAHFLAQCGHESAGFKATQENLNYSVEGLKKVFSKYFPGDPAKVPGSPVNAADYAKQPEKIASRVYGNRMGNGNEASKEGYKYRGRGYIQLTGKANYQEFKKVVPEDVVANPDLVADKYPLLSAAWFWDSRSLNELADKGASDDVVTAVTKKVNGGRIGLADRIAHFKKYYALLA
jgi:putative chitinase